MPLFHFLATLVLALSFAHPAAAQQRAAADEANDRAARFIEFTRMPLRHPLRTAAIGRISHTVGKRADASPLVIDVTLPPDKHAAAPVVLLIHGGVPDEVTTLPRSWQVYRDWGAALAGSGVATVMLDHTLGSPMRRLDQALGEVDTVLAWLAENGGALGLDTARIDVFAFSAGGLLVPALLADARPLRVSGAVMFYPSTVVVPGSPGATLITPEVARRMDLRAAAMTLSKRRVPLLILRAGGDEIPGLLPTLDASVSALLAADARVEIVNVPGAPHGFDALTTSADARDALDKALAFPRRDRDTE